MKSQFLLVVAMLGSSYFANAQIYKAKKDGVKISFFSETPMENISAVNTTAQSIMINDSIKFIINIKGFVFEKPLMQEHFNENYLESEKYPKSTFRGKINEHPDLTKDGTYKVTCAGILNMHGVDKNVTIPGTFTVKGEEITLVSNYKVKLIDYKIDRPKVVMQNIAEEIDVKLQATYNPYKKQ